MQLREVRATEGERQQVIGNEPRRGMRVWLLDALNAVEDLIYLGVALVLIGTAGALLYRTVRDAIGSGLPFAETITAAVNGVLFVVIVLELYSTVIAHFRGGGFQLRPFLIIGIISAVRHVLLVGTQSLSGETNKAFNHVQIELAVNAGVALVLVIALVLIERANPGGGDPGGLAAQGEVP
jgi:uncharacterized membrane protein (DUF373 family)